MAPRPLHSLVRSEWDRVVHVVAAGVLRLRRFLLAKSTSQRTNQDGRLVLAVVSRDPAVQFEPLGDPVVALLTPSLDQDADVSLVERELAPVREGDDRLVVRAGLHCSNCAPDRAALHIIDADKGGAGVLTH